MRSHSAVNDARSHSNTPPSRPFISTNNKDSFLSRSENSEAPFFSPTMHNTQLHSENTGLLSNDEIGISSYDQGKENDEDKKSASVQDQSQTGTQKQPAATSQVVKAPTVSIGKVDSSTSPAKMPDRIAPRVDTDVAVTVSGYSIPMADVEFSVEGANASNGKATINGVAKHAQNSAATLKLKGTSQTAPGSAGNLTVVAKQSGTVLARSNTFSVSAIPVDYSVSFNSIIKTGPKWGVKVDNSWKSDSGNLADLDQVEASESVDYPSKTGIFAKVGLTPHNSGYLKHQQFPPHQDSHTLGPVATLRGLHGNGSIVADQVFLVWDKRTGAKDIPTNNSGFQVTKELIYDAATKKSTLKVTKTGKDVTANKNFSKAGAGTVSRPVPL